MDSSKAAVEEQNKAANRELYDLIAEDYESIDGRRGESLLIWLRNTLQSINGNQNDSGTLLDIGSGSGFLTEAAEGIFAKRIAMDLSPKMIVNAKGKCESAIAGDVDSLPFANTSITCISCFATLHHLAKYEKMVEEVGRVLQKGGIFYSDHDIDLAFVNRYALLIAIYRKIFSGEKKYVNSGKGITKEMYHLAEFGEDGVDSQHVTKLLEKEGFNVKTEFHWYGLSPLFNSIFGLRSYPYKSAPLIRIIATKQ